MIIRRALWPLLLPVLLFSCHKGDPQEESFSAAPFQVTVLFAPGQLGDKGYADNVMNGLISIDDFDNHFGGDSLDVRFISPASLEEARSSLVQWVASTGNPFTKGEYERRLLVLTEPYLEKMLPDIRQQLQPTDELLFLKLEKDDIAQIASKY